MLKKLFLLLVFAFVLLCIVLLVNTFSLHSSQLQGTPPPESPRVTSEAVNRMSRALQFRTISHQSPEDFDKSAFQGFVDFLATAYPLADSLLQKEIVSGYSLLYKWPGTDPSLKPVVMMAHTDVVPIEKPQNQLEFERRIGKLKDEMYSNWDVPPFAGTVKDGYIWGRGAIDNKIGVIGNMEAVEMLLAEGYQPQRTLYLAFGHDEENGGEEGAVKIVERLKAMGVEPEFVMDEGGIVTSEKVPGVDVPVALVGTAEKGFLSVELSVNMPGGHSSMPQKETAIELLAEAIVKLRENQFPKRISVPVQEFIRNIGPEMPFLQKMVFANLWLFEGLVLNVYETHPATNATVRTTTAPTIFKSGFKDNVLPSDASATLNFRILPGETSEEVLAHISKVIDDERIKLTAGSFVSEPTEPSPTEAWGYSVVATTVKQHFPEAIVTPYLVIGGTDARHYRELTPNIYRFIPVTDPIGFHDINERISIADFERSVQFYYQLIKNANSETAMARADGAIR